MKTLCHPVAVVVVVLLAVSGGQLRVRDLVHDPRIIASGPALAPIAAGTPYSIWTLNGSNYVVAYRNSGDGDPFDIIAEIYYEDLQRSRLSKLISVPVFMEVADVKEVSIMGDTTSQLAFFRTSNQQDWLTIVSLQGQIARKVFEYGTTSIMLTNDKPPQIVAYSHSTGTTDVFKWCKAKRKILLEDACPEK